MNIESKVKSALVNGRVDTVLSRCTTPSNSSSMVTPVHKMGKKETKEAELKSYVIEGAVGTAAVRG